MSIAKKIALGVAGIGLIGTIWEFFLSPQIEYNKRLAHPDSIVTYTVKKGDCLDLIGKYEGLRPDWMRLEDWRNKAAAMNGRKHNPDSLVTGEQLNLPFYYGQ